MVKLDKETRGISYFPGFFKKFMKTQLPLILITGLLLIASCTKSTPENAGSGMPAGSTIVSGSFVSSSHPTSGTAKVVLDADGKKILVFENFSSDNGPDLRVWLSPNNNASPYHEVGLLKALNGKFFYELDSTVNYTANNRVLIWCEDFSVLFGYAVLQ